MTNIELVLNMLAEVTTTSLSKNENPKTFNESKQIAKRGGKVASVAKDEFERSTGTKVVSSQNSDNKELLAVKDKKLIDDKFD